MRIAILSQKVSWFGGKGVDLHVFKDKFSQLTCVVANNGKLIEYSLLT
jgi:hypothetical protein